MEIGSLIITGAAVSLIVEILKKEVRGEYARIGIVIVLALLSGGIYYYASDTAFWSAAVQILAYAGAVYTFIIKRFQK